MIKTGIIFGLIVLLAGILITVGLITGNSVVLLSGFALIGLTAIFGMQPGIMPGTRRDDDTY